MAACRVTAVDDLGGALVAEPADRRELILEARASAGLQRDVGVGTWQVGVARATEADGDCDAGSRRRRKARPRARILWVVGRPALEPGRQIRDDVGRGPGRILLDEVLDVEDASVVLVVVDGGAQGHRRTHGDW